jgi:hypothetical protein
MDSRIPPVRSDVVTVPSAARPTPTPVRVSFGEVLARGAGVLVAGAEAAMNVLPGGPLVAAAIRNGIGGGSGSTGSHPMLATGNGNSGLSSAMNAEGPSPIGGGGGSSVGGGFGAGGAGGTGTGTGAAGGGIEQSLQQSQEMNMYFLQIQQEVDQQNRTFTTLSNVLKAENDTVKNAIGNIR